MHPGSTTRKIRKEVENGTKNDSQIYLVSYRNRPGCPVHVLGTVLDRYKSSIGNLYIAFTLEKHPKAWATWDRTQKASGGLYPQTLPDPSSHPSHSNVS